MINGVSFETPMDPFSERGPMGSNENREKVVLKTDRQFSLHHCSWRNFARGISGRSQALSLLGDSDETRAPTKLTRKP